MKLHQHAAVSAVVSAGLYAWTGSAQLAIGSFVSGIFIDLDHILDYWIEHPFKLNLVHFFRTCEELRLAKLYLLFHSYELFVFLGLLSLLTHSPVIFGISIGMGLHLLFDHIINPIKPYAYFLFYRINKHFKNDKILELK